MLKILNIKNLILIEACEIEFQKGLNILSGETGAGKTALLEAIALVLGQRADSASIRHGAEKAVVEAAFDIENEFLIQGFLKEATIEFDPKELLLLRREISRQGRSRSMINCQMVPLPLMQKLGSFLVDMIGQHSHQELRSLEAQRSLLDLFCNTKQDVFLFNAAWTQEKEYETALDLLTEESAKRERSLETLLREKKELEEAMLQEGEEEKLFEEYQKLAHSQELTEKCAFLIEELSKIPSLLSRYKNLCDQIAVMDPSLNDSSSLLYEAFVNVKEVSHHLTGYLGHLESNPGRFKFLEERLTTLERLKKKYGNPIQYLQRLIIQYSHLENLDEEIDTLKASLQKAKENTKKLVLQLREKRKNGALAWEKDINNSLRELNMANAQFNIVLEEQARTLSGEDSIQFWLSPNKGEKSITVKENASGGELSRLLFAIKTTLASKNNTPTLIFDEIDANVGGKTASIIGTKLRELGLHRQVFCITHFPQVASCADHHFGVHKKEVEGRTFASITLLNSSLREKELQRMIGIESNS